MRSCCAAGLLLLLAAASLCVAFPRDSIHQLDLVLPEDEDLDAARRAVREANPESFADYFRKLQLAQSELSKNASVGEAEIEKVFKNHGLEIGNETQDLNGTSTIAPSTSFDPSYSTEFAETTSNKPCPAGICPNTVKPLKKYGQNTPDVSKTKVSTSTAVPATSTTVSSDEDSTSTEPDSTVYPSTTSNYWWGVSRSKPKHLKSTIARQVVNKIKTSRRRTHFE